MKVQITVDDNVLDLVNKILRGRIDNLTFSIFEDPKDELLQDLLSETKHALFLINNSKKFVE